MLRTNAIRFASALAIGAATLGGSAALASGTNKANTNIDRSPPWQRDYTDYEFKHPMKTTCKDFIEADTVYQPFIVSYLEGVAHQKYKKEVVVDEGYMPISVPSVVEACKTQPDKTVWDLVKTTVEAEK